MFPDLTGFKEMGFEVKTFNGDLYVEKNHEHYKMRFSQSYEPFNPHLKKVIDFEIPDGFIMIEFFELPDNRLTEILEDLGELFQQHKMRENYFFLFNNKLDFTSGGINVLVGKVVDKLDDYYGQRRP
jgi:hypothetical protein